MNISAVFVWARKRFSQFRASRSFKVVFICWTTIRKVNHNFLFSKSRVIVALIGLSFTSLTLISLIQIATLLMLLHKFSCKLESDGVPGHAPCTWIKIFLFSFVIKPWWTAYLNSAKVVSLEAWLILRGNWPLWLWCLCCVLFHPALRGHMGSFSYWALTNGTFQLLTTKDCI